MFIKKPFSIDDKNAQAKRDLELANELVQLRASASLEFATINKIRLWIWVKKIMIGGLFVKKWKIKESLTFLNYYFDTFFKHISVPFFTTERFESSIKNDSPKIIFTIRSNEFVSFFAFHIFNTPVIVPLSEAKFNFPLYVMSKISLSPLLELVSYPDAHLEEFPERIRDIYENGYSVLAFITPHFVDSRYVSTLTMYREFENYLDQDNIYFLYLDGFERLPLKMIKHTEYIRCDMMSKEKIFEEANAETSQEKYRAIARYFGFPDYEFEDEVLSEGPSPPKNDL